MLVFRVRRRVQRRQHGVRTLDARRYRAGRVHEQHDVQHLRRDRRARAINRQQPIQSGARLADDPQHTDASRASVDAENGAKGADVAPAASSDADNQQIREKRPSAHHGANSDGRQKQQHCNVRAATPQHRLSVADRVYEDGQRCFARENVELLPRRLVHGRPS